MDEKINMNFNTIVYVFFLVILLFEVGVLPYQRMMQTPHGIVFGPDLLGMIVLQLIFIYLFANGAYKIIFTPIN
jgi:hypothetical protein